MGLRALHQQKPSKTVLVQGASGGVGAILSRWAKGLGATVIGVTGSLAKVAKVSAHALWSGDPEFPEKLQSIAPGGVEGAYDVVGRATFAQVTSSVRGGGLLVTIGGASASPRLARTCNGVASRCSAVGGASAELFEAVRACVFADLELVRYPLARMWRGCTRTSLPGH
ncbi:zinc-binding dehydrogenase [Micromonospora sp. NPDC023888]|uniref:zinc-binding dehydrogenase n=1 Tax=Micromonospora sp. NPDC023888 TaxID=3155607 RepID=UPI0033E9D501